MKFTYKTMYVSGRAHACDRLSIHFFVNIVIFDFLYLLKFDELSTKLDIFVKC